MVHTPADAAGAWFIQTVPNNRLFVRPFCRSQAHMFCGYFGSSVIAGHGLPPVTTGIGVWSDGVGQAGMYGTVE